MLARDFREVNIFENKGIGSSPGIDTYYKTIGYCGMYLNSTWKKKSGNRVSENYTAENITLNLLSRSYPRKLIRYLTETRNKTVVKISPGIYDVGNETFLTRIIVTKELPAPEYIYLRCLGLDLENQPEETINKLTEDLRQHSDEKSYIEYVDLLTRANQKRKGETNMLVSEGLLEYFGTSSEEIRREQAEKDQAIIDAANELAESEKQRADSAEQRADYAELRANQYLAILIANGIQIPDEEQG